MCFRCLVVNEMTSSNWAEPSSSNPSQTIGQAGLLSFDFYISQVNLSFQIPHFIQWLTIVIMHNFMHSCVRVLV